MNDYNEGAFRGMTANQAWTLVADKYKQDKHQDKNLEEYLEMYKNIYNKLLEVNKKLLNNEVKAAVTTTIPAGGSTNDSIYSRPVNKTSNFPANDSHGIGENEIGAAWISKKDNKVLSCKHKETGEWRNIKISELTKTDEGYTYETDKEKLILKEITFRPNPKMPQYRIFKEGD